MRFVNPRNTIEIQLPNGQVIEGPRGAPIETFLKVLPEWADRKIVGAVINAELRELTFPVDMDARVRPVELSEADGARIYRRSVTFLIGNGF